MNQAAAQIQKMSNAAAVEAAIFHPETRLEDKFTRGLKIGEGSFGCVYEGVNRRTRAKVAIKMEPLDTKHPQLYRESKFYSLLQDASRGIPKIYWQGCVDKQNILVMELLGPTLEELFCQCGHKFSLKTILLLTDQLLERVQYLHSQDLIHRDIKPTNFVIGRGQNKNVVYMIDLGLAKRYRDAFTHAHIPYCDGKKLTGTGRYASLKTHEGVEQSRRDDLEVLGYVLLYFNLGRLPWQGVNASTKKEKYEIIHKMKAETSILQLCQDMPTEFAEFMLYCRSLKFDETPEYDYWRRKFRLLGQRSGVKYDGAESEFDWNISKPESVSKWQRLQQTRRNNNRSRAAAQQLQAPHMVSDEHNAAEDEPEPAKSKPKSKHVQGLVGADGKPCN